MNAMTEAVPPEETDLTIPEAVALAQRMQRQGQLDGAEQIYLRVLEKEPRNTDAWHFLGVVRYRRREFKDGIACVRKSLAIHPNYPDAHANLANMLLEQGQVKEAEQHLKRAIRLAPKAFPPRLALAILMRVRGRVGESIRMLESLLDEFPDHPLAHNAMGNALTTAGRLEDALQHFLKAFQLEPATGRAREQMGYVLSMLGRHDEARQLYDDWMAAEPDNPTAKHLRAAYGGTAVPERCSDGYVKKTFDSFAASFDAKLHDLEYRAPQLIEAAAKPLLGPQHGALDVLDAGCGTGLMAPLFRPWARRLAGMDLSSGMLAKARDRGLYDELAEAELTGYLQSQSADWDVITCADTFCYFGAIDDALKAAHGALRDGGWMFFTVEHDARQTEDFRLQPHGRYSHIRAYVERAVEAAGFGHSLIADEPFRMESAKPVRGLIVAARKAQRVAH